MADTDKYYYMLTTIDNPFNPHTQFDEWYAYDVSHGYNSCAYLDKMAKVSDEMSEEDYHEIIQKAIDDICKENILGLYKKI